MFNLNVMKHEGRYYDAVPMDRTTAQEGDLMLIRKFDSEWLDEPVIEKVDRIYNGTISTENKAVYTDNQIVDVYDVLRPINSPYAQAGDHVLVTRLNGESCYKTRKVESIDDQGIRVDRRIQLTRNDGFSIDENLVLFDHELDEYHVINAPGYAPVNRLVHEGDLLYVFEAEGEIINDFRSVVDDIDEDLALAVLERPTPEYNTIDLASHPPSMLIYDFDPYYTEKPSDDVFVVLEPEEQAMPIRPVSDHAPATPVFDDITAHEPSKAVQIDATLAEIGDVLKRKNHDYGDSFAQQYAKYGIMSALIRMDDKMARLSQLVQSDFEAQVDDETLDDTLADLIGYAVLTKVERDGNRNN